MATKNPDLQDKILALLKNYTLSTREISQEIGSTYATTLKHLDILLARSMVENKVYGKTKVWALKKKDPFDLDTKTLLYLLLKNNQYALIREILVTFYKQNIEANKHLIKFTNNIDLIHRYLELEKGIKWKDLQEYDILNAEELVKNDLPVFQIKIFDCKFKFGCCANLHEENKEILCFVGQKFPVLLSHAANQHYTVQLMEFSVDPNTCIIQLEKQS